ncbi:MAG: vWA domain-containing protein [Thermoanaerobaculia bacterium]|nr:vWA domain-containing protein [Thermoanaerobaculia bacterium]
MRTRGPAILPSPPTSTGGSEPTLRSLAVVLTFAVLAWWIPAPAAADLDVVFALDTTGSMSAEIREVRQRITQLAGSLADARPGERIRYGIVAYRDRGDDYVTKVLPLTEEVPEAAGFLASLEAGGGGDGPESVVAALAATLEEMPWDLSEGTDRQVFLIGDAPPHLDYEDDPDPEELILEARRSRIVIHTIGCRSLPGPGVEFFRRIAYATEGSYQHIGRVRAAEPGVLTRAVDEASRTGTTIRREAPTVPVEWIRSSGPPASGILVRQGGPEGVAQGPDGAGLLPCTLEIRLPTGFDLGSDPVVRFGPGSLDVQIDLIPGDGGTALFALDRCPPLSTPVNVLLGES